MATDANPKPVVTWHSGIAVLRDDLVHGGTKRRFLSPILAGIRQPELVYAGPSEGYAQIALAYSAPETGHSVSYFVADRARPHPLVVKGKALGVVYHPVRPGYLAVVEKRARDYVDAAPADRHLLPFGFHHPDYMDAATATMREVSRSFPSTITDVYLAWGSGLLATALAAARPDLTITAIVVGRKPKETPRRLRIIEHPETFDKPTRHRPPYPSPINFDAKVWKYAVDGGTVGTTLVWNVGA
jgi:hypothetical protein